MHAPQRNTVIQRGPRFYEQDGEVMFEHVIDGSTRHGPRPATEADMEQYPDAFEAMGRSVEINPPPVTYIDPDQPPPAEKPYAGRRARAAS